LAKRVKSLDVLRGLTILVMIFVNDLEDVAGTPAWMKHMDIHADGMTFVDVVFPAFLFIVGMSLPFAIGRRLERREPRWQIWQHILTRTLGLLVISVFMANADVVSNQGSLRSSLWTVLMYVGVVLAWNTLPREPGRRRTVRVGMRTAGVVLLVTMAVLYRGRGEPSFLQLRAPDWEILGQIGWAYLVACIVYALLRTHLTGMIGMVAFLYCLYFADALGAFSHLTWITRWVDIGSMLGSQAAITVSGVVLGEILTSDSPVETPAKRMQWALLYGLGLAATGALLYTTHETHRALIINKDLATPPWCLLSSAITIWIWVALYWLIDVRQWERWTVILEPAGQNPLLAYILPEILLPTFDLVASALGTSNLYNDLGVRFATGFWRSVVFAVVVTWLAGQLGRVGVQLKL